MVEVRVMFRMSSSSAGSNSCCSSCSNCRRISAFVRGGRCGVLGEALLAELEGGGGARAGLGRFPAVLGRLPAVVRREVVVAVVVVRRTLGRVRAGEILLLNPVAGDTLLTLIVAAMISGDDVPTPAGDAPGG